MKQAIITTQVIHTVEFDETKVKIGSSKMAEVMENHIRLSLAHEETPFRCVELEILPDPNPVVVDI